MTEYDAAAEMEAYEKLLPPRWRTVDCPTCGQAAGFPCESLDLRETTSPHVARRRVANKAGVLR